MSRGESKVHMAMWWIEYLKMLKIYLAPTIDFSPIRPQKVLLPNSQIWDPLPKFLQPHHKDLTYIKIFQLN